LYICNSERKAAAHSKGVDGWEIDSFRFGVAETLVVKYKAKEISRRAISTEEMSSTGIKIENVRKTF
jgi:hypothetical protein